MSKRKREDFSDSECEEEKETTSDASLHSSNDDDDEEQVKSPHESDDDNENSSHSSSDNDDDESNNPFLIKGLKTQLNDQPDEIIDQIFTFIPPKRFLPLSMVSHKFRTCWEKTPTAIIHQWQSRMNHFIHSPPKDLDVLRQVKKKMKQHVKSFFSKAMKDMKREEKEMQKKEMLASFLELCEQHDKERTKRLRPILKQLTEYTLEEKDVCHDDQFVYSKVHVTFSFDVQYYEVEVRSDGNGIETWRSYEFWKCVEISREDMLWLLYCVKS